MVVNQKHMEASGTSAAWGQTEIYHNDFFFMEMAGKAYTGSAMYLPKLVLNCILSLCQQPTTSQGLVKVLRDEFSEQCSEKSLVLTLQYLLRQGYLEKMSR